MKSREQEYKEIFLAEALEEYDALNLHMTELEKTPDNDKVLAEIFRLLHNLKANAKATGYLPISDLAHKLESVFSAIRSKELEISDKIFSIIFEGIDSLGQQLRNIDKPQQDTARYAKLAENLDSIIRNLSADQIQQVSPGQYHTAQNIALSELIYIPIHKLDDLMNLIGELIIDRDRIMSISKETDNEELKAVSSHLLRITNELQQGVMDARLVSIGYLFNKFPRIIRDIALTENKQVNLDIQGQDIQIDRNILQVLTDSILHLVRNAVIHGLEEPAQRKKAAKSAEGSIQMSARSDRDTVVIEIKDDGKGIDIDKVRQSAVDQQLVSARKADEMTDKDLLSLLFESGFTLAEKVTEYAGRGVGLDVVKNAIEALGGRIQLESEKGTGTTFRLFVPTSIAVKGALLFEVGGSAYALPLIHTDNVVQLPHDQIHHIAASLIADIKGETIPLIDLYDLFYGSDLLKPVQNTAGRQGLLNIIVVSYNNRRTGLIVDKLIRQQDIVVKPLQKPVNNIELFGGVTLLGTGEVCLVLDVPSLSKKVAKVKAEASMS